MSYTGLGFQVLGVLVMVAGFYAAYRFIKGQRVLPFVKPPMGDGPKEPEPAPDPHAEATRRNQEREREAAKRDANQDVERPE